MGKKKTLSRDCAPVSGGQQEEALSQKTFDLLVISIFCAIHELFV